jgi:hypothetical protein
MQDSSRVFGIGEASGSDQARELGLRVPSGGDGAVEFGGQWAERFGSEHRIGLEL